MRRFVITNARVVTPHRTLERGFVEIGGATILAVGPMADLEAGAGLPDDAEVWDAAGRVAAPGFIDIHAHGGGGHDLMDATPEAVAGMAEAHARGGTTGLLPTTITSSDAELAAAMRAYRAAAHAHSGSRPDTATRRGAKLLGLHLEGQYFADSQRGAQDARFLKNPRPEEYLPLLAEYPEIRRWSAAPELPGAIDLGAALATRGILASIAHTEADYDTVLRAMDAGYSHLTHFYLGMSTIRRINCYRVPGVIEAGFLLDGLTLELLADGHHVPPTLLQLAYKVKGAERIALVTDGNRAVGMPNGEYLLGSLANGQPFTKENGGSWMRDRTAFAAGVVTFNVLVRTMVEAAGVPLADALKMASTTPARLIGCRNKGLLSPGCDADVVVLESDFAVALTVVEGEVVYRKEEPR